jgi:hypothetical protein
MAAIGELTERVERNLGAMCLRRASGLHGGATYPDAAPDAIAPPERGRAALAAIPRSRSSPLDRAECALTSAYAVRASFLTSPSGFALLAQSRAHASRGGAPAIARGSGK